MKYVKVHSIGSVGYIVLNRPDKRNALNFEFVAELKTAFTTFENDINNRVIIIKANGEVFCAGADLSYLKQLQDNTFEQNLEDSNHLKELFKMIFISSKIVISQVEGHAIAGGCGLATVSDFCFSVPEVKFGYSEVKIGFIPAIVMVFLLRKIGDAKARLWLLTGKIFDATKAFSDGLITEIVDEKEINDYVLAFANKLSFTTSSQSIKDTKHMIAHSFSMPINDALDYAANCNAKARSNKDCITGIAKFLNKENITW